MAKANPGKKPATERFPRFGAPAHRRVPSHPHTARSFSMLIAIVVAVACLGTVVASPSPRFIWNASASSPRGLYQVIDHRWPSRNDMVLARLTPAFAQLAAQREYLPAGVPLVKLIAAVPGDQVCGDPDRLRINGRVVAWRKAHDAHGRPLPTFQGCQWLGPDEFMLLGTHPWSFDGRYVGVTRRADILARVRLIWPA